jgi:hypothetical protein
MSRDTFVSVYFPSTWPADISGNCSSFTGGMHKIPTPIPLKHVRMDYSIV